MNNQSELVRDLENLGFIHGMGEWKYNPSIIANFILARDKKNYEPLVKAVEESDRIGSNESTVPAWQRLDKAVFETLKNLGADNG